LDVTGNARISQLSKIDNRDTLLTYNPDTKEVGYTIRPRCADSATTITLVVGTDVPNGDSIYLSPSLIGKSIKSIHREGDELSLSTSDGYEYSQDDGALIFHPIWNYRERIKIEYLCVPGYAFSSLKTEDDFDILTESGVIILK
jgi:hypothetical protein